MFANEKTENVINNTKHLSPTLLVLPMGLIGILSIILFLFFGTKNQHIDFGTSTSNQISETPNELNVTISSRSKSDSWFGLVVAKNVSLQSSFKPSNILHEDAFATGLVKVANSGSKIIFLPKNTKILSKNGIIFFTKSNVSVPANSFVMVDVVASTKGQVGNVPAGVFNFFDKLLKDNKNLTAESIVDFTGGVHFFGNISTEDEASARDVILQKLIEKGQTELRSEVGGASAAYTVDDPIINFDEIDPNTGLVTAHATGKIVSVTYPEDTASRLVNSDNLLVVINEFNLEEQTASITITAATSTIQSSDLSVESTTTEIIGANDSVQEVIYQDQTFSLPDQPEQKAIAACHNKSSGNSCSFSTPEYVFTGTCSIITTSILECVPDSR